jgi:hypothetical protein
MRFTSGHFVVLTLLGIGAAQAAPYDLPAHGEGSVVFTPAARPHFSNLDPRPDPLAEPGRRYGIGYDARHGIDTDGRHPDWQSQPGNRMDPGTGSGARSQPSAHGSPSGGAGRGGRGR